MKYDEEKAMTEREPLLDVDSLVVEFPSPRKREPDFRAVDRVSLSVQAGETVGLLGESGSGKSTLGNAILGLVHPTAGSIRFRGRELMRLKPRERRELSDHLQVVFQDPYGTLNPSLTVGQSLTQPLRVRHRLSRGQAREKVAEVLGQVGLPPEAMDRYPARFSGGQRQRIAIARALVGGPDLIICDEPTSALDLSVQAQVLNLLVDLQRVLGVSYLFISHDIDVVRYVSHRVAILRRGQIVEQGSTEEVSRHPRHPYTRTLLDAAPIPDPRRQADRRKAAQASTLARAS
ncbi:ATP-binding cassette domain-containing protein [Amycolatopsis thermoflava]